MAKSNKEAKKEIKTYNPTKSKTGKIIITILAIGMFLSVLVAAIWGIVSVFTP